MKPSWEMACVECGAKVEPMAVQYRCACGGTLEVRHGAHQTLTTEEVDKRRMSLKPVDRSGVWRFREWVLPLPIENMVTRGEGNTGLYDTKRVASYAGVDALALKHEGENPTGSFKDRGLTTGTSIAKTLGMTRVAVASTGNTSAALASYAALAGMEAIVFIPDGKIAFGKLGQTIAYGAKTLQIKGDFDDAMRLVEAMCLKEGVYLLNSVNPYRIEGQKAIGFEIFEQLGWRVPDWIVLPGGNLGNNTAIAKGFLELKRWGLIDRLPRIAVVQAHGANPLYRAWTGDRQLHPVKAETLASAIRIGSPVSFTKSMRGLEATSGVVTEVSDQDILDAKAVIDSAGIGAEPASCATVAGLKRLVAEGVIRADEHIVGVLTGHVMKDPGLIVDYHTGQLPAPFTFERANRPIRVEADLDSIRRAIVETDRPH
ncbi:MAG: threonine synthase [Myxococcota bacterium]|nr:threonine synthase [Myxococcota bacterium]